MNEELARAIWAGDLDRLEQLAPCDCCCDEHTFIDCPARLWNGCRSGQPYGRDQRREEEQAWQEFYEKHHGLTAAEFYNIEA